jgi:hypothetical protein
MNLLSAAVPQDDPEAASYDAIAEQAESATFHAFVESLNAVHDPAEAMSTVALVIERVFASCSEGVATLLADRLKEILPDVLANARSARARRFAGQ